ncbi:hypothetical protein BCR44DRAFT_1425615 [Catenaria anguillulae PL171]|uniref:Uncharacterized protein n=1 Tax=Catenaria anguillulae PL171 TaxID=765915 RepID=A0A1Y2I0N5_9FUNG|nr:hypothetical protein BCR44DRAFT_1425615 [Catenaria anguillulae PL171]
MSMANRKSVSRQRSTRTAGVPVSRPRLHEYGESQVSQQTEINSYSGRTGQTPAPT